MTEKLLQLGKMADPYLSVVIPARNESGCIEETLSQLDDRLGSSGISYEIVVVDDGSTDATNDIVELVSKKNPHIKLVQNSAPNGFGLAIRVGLENARGEAVAIYMADMSDSPDDLVRFCKVMKERDVDCVFGSRFSEGGEVVDYPRLKLWINRLANTFIRIVFGFKYNDVTNAFKLYRSDVIAGISPILSNHFNITVELPLKAIVRGYTYEIAPNSWHNRKTGESKLKVKEMGSRYLFIVLYCFIEKWLSKGDYKKS